MQPVLEFVDLTKDYRTPFQRKKFRALDGFSLTVNPGEIFGFLGPNGAGKTTAIHIALGLSFPTRGGGTMLGQRFGNARTRRRVGFLAENVALYHRAPEKLLRFYGGLNGMRDPQLAKRTKELLEAVDLKQVADKSASKFSRGMLQRLGLAQALMNDPELLILDEPTSALDPAARVMVRELLVGAKRGGKTVFLSSHLLSEIELVCDRIAILNRGRLVRVGALNEILKAGDESEIIARNAPTEYFSCQILADGLCKLTVKSSEQRATIEKLWATGAEIVSVVPVRQSLENLFLSLTAGEKRSMES